MDTRIVGSENIGATVGGWGGGDPGNRRSTEVIAVSSSTGAHLRL